jgi:hypothetical protein
MASGNPLSGMWKFESTRKSLRNPFPRGVGFFTVPLAVYEKGLVAQMKPSEALRYFTLCRASNYNYTQPVPISLKRLRQLDGVSERTAWYVHRRLAEWGLILIEKTSPFTYRLVVQPGDWHLDRFPLLARKLVRKAGLSVKA